MTVIEYDHQKAVSGGGLGRSDKESELQIIADCERNVESDDWSITVTNTVTNTNLFASYSYFHCSTTE